METPQSVLAEIIPPVGLIPANITKSEPDPSDLSDLDTLLADSMALVVRPTNRRILKETKAKVEQFVKEREAYARWELLESIEVWAMPRCKCGTLGTMTFVKNMRKLKRVGQPLIHWETVAEHPADISPRLALIEQSVSRCEYCADLPITEFRPFQEVIK
jgi:hypothetical protein